MAQKIRGLTFDGNDIEVEFVRPIDIREAEVYFPKGAFVTVLREFTVAFYGDRPISFETRTYKNNKRIDESIGSMWVKGYIE